MAISLADVLSVFKSVSIYLIVLGIIFAVSIAVMIVIRKASVPKRKFVRAQALLVMLVSTVAVIDLILTGSLETMMSHVESAGKITENSAKEAVEISESISGEGIVLLENKESFLPFDRGTRLNVFGWASVNPIWGGEGSGALSNDLDKVSLLEGLENYGFELNSELSDFYTEYKSFRPSIINSYGRGFEFEWTLPEPPAANYTDNLIENAKNFSDKAMIVISRGGGEETDIPKSMIKAKYIGNTSDYPDFTEEAHYLELSQTEQAMVELVCSHFENVVLVYNGANAFELGFIRNFPQIKSVLWCPAPGQYGFNGLGAVMSGEVNPSGKTTDTFIYDLKISPSFNNFGSFFYENLYEFVSMYHDTASVPSFVRYNEGIYVGYRFYETAYDEGIIDYDSMVMYPFGYGLSYTSFSQEMGDISEKNGVLSFEVKVTNTGSVSGKDVVEVYYTPPYTNGGIEKASVNLIAFDKTETLEPGESCVLDFYIKTEDMASYDADGHGCYVLESGDYEISIRSDSHHIIDKKTCSIENTIVYNEGNMRSTDRSVAVNRFDDAKGSVIYLSRADHFANYWDSVAEPKEHTMLPDELKANFVNNSNYDPTKYDDPNDEMPQQGVSGDLTIYDMYGVSKDDPKWDQLLSQMSIDDMNLLISQGFGTPAIASIGKPAIVENDGPAGVKNYTDSSIGFPCETMLAHTWNTELAAEFGDSIGTMAEELGVTGWFAPAMNIHRNAFQGRAYEYYSEDPVLSGIMAVQVVKNSQDHGIYACIKHFALNEQETNRNSMLCTWANEQSIREIYLKPFELCVKEAGAKSVMSAFNYIGITWAGGYSPLLIDVLRNEWGFDGFVVTDYFGDEGNGYLNADQAVRNGGDIMLLFLDTYYNKVNDRCATGVKLMRNACKNYLYVIANCSVIAGSSAGKAMAGWKLILIAVNIFVFVLVAVLEVLAVKNFLKRKET